MQERPNLFPRHEGFGNAQNEGNMEELRKYREENKPRLEAQAAAARAEAKQLLQLLAPQGTLPMTNEEWLSWLDSHEDDWEQHLRNSQETRRSLSHRLKPSADLLKERQACPRLQPIQEHVLVRWKDPEEPDVHSDLEPETEQELEQELEEVAADPEGESEDLAEQPVPGTNVVAEYSSPSFTLEDYHKRGKGQDCKMRVRPRFHGDLPKCFGKKELSRTLLITSFDHNPDEPAVTYICLRSWALYRASQGGWLAYSRDRQQWFDGEVDSLKQEVARLRQPGKTTSLGHRF